MAKKTELSEDPELINEIEKFIKASMAVRKINC